MSMFRLPVVALAVMLCAAPWTSVSAAAADAPYDVIIRGGENIAAAEVEDVLVAHPEIRDAVAVGYADAELGERVCAFVIADGGFDLEQCRSWFATRGVARFKTPERVVRLDAFPVLAAGKVDRAALRQLAARHC